MVKNRKKTASSRVTGFLNGMGKRANALVCASAAAMSGLLLVVPSAHAGPASPFSFKIQQPDGKVFTARVRGDEFQNWVETVDGYTVIQNPASGAFEYALADGAGLPVLSGVVVVPDGAVVNVPQTQWPAKHLKPPRNTELEVFQKKALDEAYAKRFVGGAAFVSPTGTWAPNPVSGSKKILMVLVNFQNVSLQPGAATYWGDVVHSTSTPSVAKYYQDNSYGVVSVVPVTSTQPGSPNGVVVVNLAQDHPNCGKFCTEYQETTWINSALAAASTYVNFPSLDTNADGTISVDEALVYFVLAGYEKSGTSLTPSIWGHAWGSNLVSVAGKNVNHWALNGERYNESSLMKMGIITHEMGHAMGGLPDLYDTSGNNAGLGIFSLMASGSWGAKSGEQGGATPVGLDAWSRQYLGWSTPREPANGTNVSFPSPQLPSSTSAVMLMNTAVSTSEYWLVENRPPVGWDAGMYAALGAWSGGLLIQHIDGNIGTKSGNSFNKFVSGSHQGNMAEEASTASCSLYSASAWGGCKTLLYYSGNNTSFNAGSVPDSNYYSGTTSSLGVTNVTVASGTMTADIQTPTVSFLLTLNRVGSGRVTSVAIDCGSTCSASYPSGTVVVLTATPSPGGSFTGWSGACSGVSTCSVNMSAARSVTATFTAIADFPAGGVLPTGWVQPSGSALTWAGTTGSTFAGTYGLRAGAIADNQFSRVSYTGNFSAGAVSFARRVSSESTWDSLRFFIDGVQQGSWSGEVPWSVVSYPITAGTHTVMWEYRKDGSVSSGSDTAWIDEVLLPLAAAVTGTSAPWLDLLLVF